MTDWRHVRTQRLWLDVSVDADVDDLFAIQSDPRSWQHLPSGRHTDRSASEQMVRAGQQGFAEHGLDYWSVRDVAGGPLVGRGGCSVPRDPTDAELPWWNLYYRFGADVHRRGYATEMGLAAIAAAREVDPDRPVLAFLLEHNVGSRRTAERLGLSLVWRGPDRDNPDPEAVRLVYLDREPTPDLTRVLEREMG